MSAYFLFDFLNEKEWSMVSGCTKHFCWCKKNEANLHILLILILFSMNELWRKEKLKMKDIALGTFHCSELLSYLLLNEKHETILFYTANILLSFSGLNKVIHCWFYVPERIWLNLLSLSCIKPLNCRDDEFDIDLEEIMIMEAIWQSIQVYF